MPEIVKKTIRTIPEFPQEGIMFRDITTVLKDAEGLKHTVDFLPLRYDEELTEYRLKKYGKRVPMEKYAEYSLERELFLRNLAIEEFAEGGMMIYE